MAQQTAIAARLDVSKLPNRNFVTRLTDQYLLTMQENNISNTGGDTTLATLAVQSSGLIA